MIVSALQSYFLSRNPKSKHHGISLINLVRWYINSAALNKVEELESNKLATFKATKIDDELVNRYFLMIGDVDSKKFEKVDQFLSKERRWRRWVDEHFVHVLSPNIYRSLDESYKSFQHFSTVSQWEKLFSSWEIFVIKNLGATIMYLVAKSLKRKYGLKENVRESLYESCNYWLKSIGPNQKFMGGDRPNLADLV